MPTILTVCAVLAACETTTDPQPPTWDAALEGQAGFLGVSGSSVVTSTAVATTAAVEIMGATVGAVHPWHVHAGTCASGGPIVGPAGSYPFLEVGAAGTASANATVPVPLSAAQSYFVNVHLSAADLDTIVACGDMVLR